LYPPDDAARAADRHGDEIGEPDAVLPHRVNVAKALANVERPISPNRAARDGVRVHKHGQGNRRVARGDRLCRCHGQERFLHRTLFVHFEAPISRKEKSSALPRAVAEPLTLNLRLSTCANSSLLDDDARCGRRRVWLLGGTRRFFRPDQVGVPPAPTSSREK